MPTDQTRDTLNLALQTYFEGLVSEQFLSAESFAQSIAEEEAATAILVTPAFLVFYWDLDDITDPIKMLSAYKAKNIVSQDKEPKPRFDDITLTDDEDNILMRLLKKAATKVYSEIAAYGKGICGGYLFNQGTLPADYDDEAVYNQYDLFYVDDQLYLALCDETPAGTDPEDTDWFLAVGEEYNTYHKIVFTLTYNTNMDPSMISVLDDNLEDALVKLVTLRWYKSINEIALIPLAQEEYDEAISDVRSAAWYRKTMTRRRTEMI
jgi:hypothetical protein